MSILAGLRFHTAMMAPLLQGVWVVVGVLLLLSRGNRWFLAVQLLALVGQGLGGALVGQGLGDWLQVPSNACEQLVTWAPGFRGRRRKITHNQPSN